MPMESPITIIEGIIARRCQPTGDTVGSAADEPVDFGPDDPDAEDPEVPCK
jgi:hypothetical protein